MNRDWLAKLLTAIGFSVKSADYGEAGIRNWKEWGPHLILMDVHMPVMDGLEGIRWIKADPHGKETFIVALTASAMDVDREAASQSGANDFLSKPCRKDELLRKICGYLNIDYEYEELSRDDKDAIPLGDERISFEKLGILPLELLNEFRGATQDRDKSRLD